MRILVADGDANCLQSLEIMLGAGRFNVYGTDSGEEAIDLGKLYDYDAIVLSETPDVHTDTVIRSLRNARVGTPVIVVSARGGPEHVAAALDLGADDYMTKPFHHDELIARINAVVRRSRGHAQSILTIGPLTINISTQTASVNGSDVYLTGKQFRMLELLMLRQNTVQSKEAFLNHLYGGFDEPDVKIVDVFVCLLRKKLTKAGAPADMIETVWGRGYMIRSDKESPSLMPELRDMVA